MPITTRKTSGFTVMELLIATAIAGIIAAFAIPNYTKALTRQQVKRLTLTANLIAGAQEIYKARNRRYWCDPGPGPCSDLASINSGLGINIVAEKGITYTTHAISGSEKTVFRVNIADGKLFTIEDATAPPLDITCTNSTTLLVCSSL